MKGLIEREIRQRTPTLEKISTVNTKGDTRVYTLLFEQGLNFLLL